MLTIDTQKLVKKLTRHPLVPALAEKRKHPRIPLRLPTEYFPLEAANARLCYTIDISENGALLCLPEKMNVDERLRVQIYYYFDYDLTIFEALGEVVWVKKMEDFEREYRCALEFIELAPADSANLKRFLSKIFY